MTHLPADLGLFLPAGGLCGLGALRRGLGTKLEHLSTCYHPWGRGPWLKIMARPMRMISRSCGARRNSYFGPVVGGALKYCYYYYYCIRLKSVPRTILSAGKTALNKIGKIKTKHHQHTHTHIHTPKADIRIRRQTINKQMCIACQMVISDCRQIR